MRKNSKKKEANEASKRRSYGIAVGKFIELGQAELENILTPQIEEALAIEGDLTEKDINEFNTKSFYEDDEIDEEEMLEPIDPEMDVEVGEGELDEWSLSEDPDEYSEGFIDFAIRRIEEDFKNCDDKDLKNKLINHIKKNYSLSFSIPNEEDLIENYSENLRREYYGIRSDDTNLLDSNNVGPSIPNIIFELEGDKISYEINLGNLDSYRFNNSFKLKANTEINIEGASCPLSSLPNLLENRRVSLNAMANFLIEKHSDAIRAHDMRGAIDLLEPLQNNDFLTYLKNLENLGVKADEPLVSRIIKGKYAALPCGDIISLKKFFERKNVKKTVREIEILRTAMSIFMERGYSSSPTASDHLIILIALLDIDVKNKSVRNKIFSHLKEIFNEDDWAKLGLSGKGGRIAKSNIVNDEQLTEIINSVIKELNINKELFTTDKIKELRLSVK
jgi:hypothetical protein